MSEQPEPDSGYAADSRGRPWVRQEDGQWHHHVFGEHRWSTACINRGPMTPLLPDHGWEQEGVPVICRVVRGTHSRLTAPDHVKTGTEYLALRTPSGEVLETVLLDEAEDYGLPVPAVPAPSLPERLDRARNIVSGNKLLHGVTDGDFGLTMGDLAELLAEARDALKAASQQ